MVESGFEFALVNGGKVVAFFIAWLILEEALVAGGAPDSRKGVEQVMALKCS